MSRMNDNDFDIRTIRPGRPPGQPPVPMAVARRPMTDQQTSRTTTTEAHSPVAETGLGRCVCGDWHPVQFFADAALAAEPRSDAVTAPDEPSHPEERCQRCSRPNVWSWHAPSPLWNAVMRQPDGSDLYGIVCPPCFAELAGESGFAPEGVDIAALWDDAEGRVWDAALCLWVEREPRAASASVPPPLDESALARALHEHRMHPLSGACSYCKQDAHVLFGIAAVRADRREASLCMFCGHAAHVAAECLGKASCECGLDDEPCACDYGFPIAAETPEQPE